MALTKQTMSGQGVGAPTSTPAPQGKGKRMAKVKVRILMPTAFEAQGIKTWKTEKKELPNGTEVEVEVPGGQLEFAEIDDKLAADLIAAGHAEKA